MFQAYSKPIYAADKTSQPPRELIGKEANPNEKEPSRRKVLVVDDQKLIVDTIAEILEEAGYYVMAAYDGWAALEAASRLRPDYLLSDVLMPRMNGVELAIAIRKMHPKTRIMLFSGQAGISEILLDGQRRGFEFELIAKPIHPLKLIELLKEE